MKSELYVFWDTVKEFCATIAKDIQEQGKHYTSILAISRGGLVPATILSHMLDIPRVFSLSPAECQYAFMRGYKPIPVILEFTPNVYYAADALLVDEIEDSGRTLALMACMYPGIDAAVMVSKKESPDSRARYIGARMITDNWIVFPWEK